MQSIEAAREGGSATMSIVERVRIPTRAAKENVTEVVKSLKEFNKISDGHTPGHLLSPATPVLPCIQPPVIRRPNVVEEFHCVQAGSRKPKKCEKLRRMGSRKIAIAPNVTHRGRSARDDTGLVADHQDRK